MTGSHSLEGCDTSQITLATPGMDGIHLKVRLEEDKVCLPVMVVVRADVSMELIALDDGYRGPYRFYRSGEPMLRWIYRRLGLGPGCPPGPGLPPVATTD